MSGLVLSLITKSLDGDSVYRLYEELENAQDFENEGWGLSNRKQSSKETVSIFKDLSNKIKLFEIKSLKQKPK